MKFYFSEVDAELSLKEMITAILLGALICSMPFLLKGFLLWIGM